MNRTARTTARLAGALIAGTLTLTACSSDTSGESAASSSSSEQASFNEADVTFAQGMLPHHEQAVEMAQMVEGRTENPEIIDLAARIEAAQGPEIETLTGWLEDWGQDVPDGGDDMGSMGSDSMGSMMSEQDMADLMAASGPQFDQLFLSQMVVHHTGAVEMAQTEVDEGQNADAVQMATDIVDSQTAEIEEMQLLLSNLGG